MRRLTISVDEQLATQFDELIERKGYLNRSEAFRDLVRGSLEESRLNERHRPPLHREGELCL